MKNSILILVILFSSMGNAARLSNFSVCFSPAGHCDAKLISFVSTAKNSVDMAIYSLTLPQLGQTIAKLHASGVKVRLVVDAGEAKTNSSAPLVARLSRMGIPVKFGNVRGIMHDKFTIVDGRMLETGSFNYSNNATNLNAENQIYLDNPEVVAQYRAQFEMLFANGLPPH